LNGRQGKNRSIKYAIRIQRRDPHQRRDEACT
jgi:hypothetical protein